LGREGQRRPAGEGAAGRRAARRRQADGAWAARRGEEDEPVPPRRRALGSGSCRHAGTESLGSVRRDPPPQGQLLNPAVTAEELIAALRLEPHPEGGCFREIYRDTQGARGAATSIYYLLREWEISRWHRGDAVGIWHFHAGAALELET